VAVLQVAILVVGLAVDAALAVMPVLMWLRGGRDPHFTDDDSVLMPSPPPDFSPALASVMLAGRATRRTIMAGLMTLASENLICFRPEPSPIGHRASIDLTPHSPHHVHLPDPEAALYVAIRDHIRRFGYVRALDISRLNVAFAEFTRALDITAVARGWVLKRPGATIHAWRIVAGVEVVAGALVGWVAASWASAWISESYWPVAGAVAAVGIGALGAGAITFVVSGAMPARTKDGAMLAAMLSAYRRTLIATIKQAKSLDQVVEMRPLPWVGTPTEEIAWGVAFNLERQIDSLLGQSLEISDTGGWPTGIRDWFSIV
jgi:hypothetical protein